MRRCQRAVVKKISLPLLLLSLRDLDKCPDYFVDTSLNLVECLKYCLIIAKCDAVIY